NNKVFSVNLLASHQSDLAARFAGRPEEGEPYDFLPLDWGVDPVGLPLVRGASATFTCTLTEATEVGTHLVFFGEVLHASAGKDRSLGYSERTYGSLGPDH